MCVAALAWHAHPRWRLVAIGNRDELHARSAAPLARWTDGSGILAGRDRYVWETVGAQRTGNVHDGVGEDDFVTMQTVRGATSSPAQRPW